MQQFCRTEISKNQNLMLHSLNILRLERRAISGPLVRILLLACGEKCSASAFLDNCFVLRETSWPGIKGKLWFRIPCSWTANMLGIYKTLKYFHMQQKDLNLSLTFQRKSSRYGNKKQNTTFYPNPRQKNKMQTTPKFMHSV